MNHVLPGGLRKKKGPGFPEPFIISMCDGLMSFPPIAPPGLPERPAQSSAFQRLGLRGRSAAAIDAAFCEPNADLGRSMSPSDPLTYRRSRLEAV